MSLPVVNGRGFLISDGVELKFGKSGNAYARLPLSFKNTRKDQVTGQWVHDKEILIEATAFGFLAEQLAEIVTSRQELAFTGEVYVEEYEGKRYVKANLLSAWPVKENRGDGSALVRGDRSPVAAGVENIPF